MKRNSQSWNSNVSRAGSAAVAVAVSLAGFVAFADFSLSNEFVSVVFDGKGRVSSIREASTGRELVGEKVPFMSVTRMDGTVTAPVECVGDALGGLRFVFPDGECRVAITPFDGGWTFQTVSMSVKDCNSLLLGRIVPSCNAEKGSLSNVVMDDRSGVVLRAYMPEIDTDYAGIRHMYREIATESRDTFVSVNREFGFVGMRYGLSAGPADKLLAMLRGMAKAAGMVQTGCGGPWSLEAEENRGAYLFATWLEYAGADDWVRLMEKAGCRALHLHAWWLDRGSYEVNPLCFPNGVEDMKKLADRLHAMGRRVTTHTLSAVVEFGSKYVSPEWFDDYAVDASYTLARPYRRGDADLWVTTKPDESVQAKIMHEGTNGNVLRIGNDLLQYDDFTTEPPYRFTGVHVAREPYGDAQTQMHALTRAVGGEYATSEGGTVRTRTLTVSEYPAGQRVDYLHHRYAEFVAKPGSRLAERLTDRLAEVYNAVGLDGIYFDGAEAMNSRYAIDWMRERVIAKLRPRNGVIVNSTSCRNSFNWWSRSLAGTWDHPTFAPRGFNDRHIRVYRDYCRADFLRIDLGWWNTHAGSEGSRGYFPEEQDYVGCKTTANDYTISLQTGGARPHDDPLDFAADQQVTIFGKWERARYARAFRPELLERMKTPGEDWRFRQDASGTWTVAPLECPKHRIGSRDYAAWTVQMREAGPVSLRVEALYAADRKAKPVRVLDASHLPGMERSSQEGVTLTATTGSDPEHGETIRLTAVNSSAEANSAWAAVSRTFPAKQPADFAPAFSLWVKGDGSGATLNVQMKSWVRSEHYVKLDFAGWRKFEIFLRERDADKTEQYGWPYETMRRLNNPGLFMMPMNGRNINAVGYYLNGIPKGKSATVEIGPWDAYPQRRGVVTDATVVLNGTKLSVPFALEGGDFAELEGGAWTHYAETGEPIERVAAHVAAAVVAGDNAVSYSGQSDDGGFGRAEVTVFREGRSEPAFVELSAEQRRLMDVEYEMPVLMNPSKGLVGDIDVHVRPGERAGIGFEILGPIANPSVGGRKIPVVLRDFYDRVASYDGKTWQAIRLVPGKCGPDNRTVAAKRDVIAEGTFAEPLPVLSGGMTRIPITADSAEGARVTFFKRYMIRLY